MENVMWVETRLYSLSHILIFGCPYTRRWSILWRYVSFVKCPSGKLLMRGYTCIYLYRPSLGLISAWTLFCGS